MDDSGNNAGAAYLLTDPEPATAGLGGDEGSAVVQGGGDPTSYNYGHIGAFSGANLPESGSLRISDADVRYDTGWYGYLPNVGMAHWISADEDLDGDGRADLAVSPELQYISILYDWWQPDAWPND